MTVQEQISRLNNVFERWHEEFDSMDQKRQKLETIYAGDVQQIKARFAAEKILAEYERRDPDILSYC